MERNTPDQRNDKDLPNQSNVEWLLNPQPNLDPAHDILRIFVAKELLTDIAEIFETPIKEVLSETK